MVLTRCSTRSHPSERASNPLLKIERGILPLRQKTYRRHKDHALATSFVSDRSNSIPMNLNLLSHADKKKRLIQLLIVLIGF
ncbi:hypothetical protein Sjap_006749 [Stephania japonica]|uniref:Uncharacterized protein n=1 Tax=Stephania japonica TaxID=461633 RepID=A0AAP0PN40_9MAGN